MENKLFDIETYNERDPNPWLAMYLDESIPMYDGTKRALMRDNDSWSARYLMPLFCTCSKLSLFLIHILKYLFPRTINAPKTLHRMLAWGLKTWVSADANYLIFRHFHVGSEILGFIAANIDGIDIKTSPLYPNDFEDVKDNLFLQHDLNLYNFVIRLNTALRKANVSVEQKDRLDLSMVSEAEMTHITFPSRWTNILDLRSAIELFTPFYQLFLTSNDFVRAANSLQLDETIGIYAATILGEHKQLGLINNRHPMVPNSTFSASYRLVLHGLAAETLHAILVKRKSA